MRVLAGEAVDAVVRGSSPILSVVPEDRSLFGEVRTMSVVAHHPV